MLQLTNARPRHPRLHVEQNRRFGPVSLDMKVAEWTPPAPLGYRSSVPIPRAVARFNRVVTNPVQRLWAGRLPGFGIVEHIGRKTGGRYRTPVNVRRRPDGFDVALTYGAETDWVRNVLAAGGAHVVYRGKRFDVTDPTVDTGPDVLAEWPAVARPVLRLLGVDSVMHLHAV